MNDLFKIRWEEGAYYKLICSPVPQWIVFFQEMRSMVQIKMRLCFLVDGFLKYDGKKGYGTNYFLSLSRMGWFFFKTIERGGMVQIKMQLCFLVDGFLKYDGKKGYCSK